MTDTFQPPEKAKPYIIKCEVCGNEYGSRGTHECKGRPGEAKAQLENDVRVIRYSCQQDEKINGKVHDLWPAFDRIVGLARSRLPPGWVMVPSGAEQMSEKTEITNMPRWGANDCKTISLTGPVGKMMATPANGDTRSVCSKCGQQHFSGEFTCINCLSAAKNLTDDKLCYELREIAKMLRARECPDAAAQCDEAAFRIENPHD